MGMFRNFIDEFKKEAGFSESNAPEKKAQVSNNPLDVFPPDKIVVIDTETTGLSSRYDEVLSLAITDINGSTLFYQLVRPTKKKSWPKAEAINGIGWKHVKNKKPITAYVKVLQKYLNKDRMIVGYNLDFDLRMLRASGILVPAQYTFDVMKEFQYAHPEIGKVKLIEAAAFYGYRFRAHNALEDTKATAYLYRALMNDRAYQNRLNGGKSSKSKKYAPPNPADRVTPR